SLSTETFVSEPFSISESLIMLSGAISVQIGVEARVVAFREALTQGFAGADLQDPAIGLLEPGRGNTPWIWQHPRTGPINIPRMCLTFFPAGWLPPGGSR